MFETEMLDFIISFPFSNSCFLQLNCQFFIVIFFSHKGRYVIKTINYDGIAFCLLIVWKSCHLKQQHQQMHDIILNIFIGICSLCEEKKRNLHCTHSECFGTF